MEVQCTQKGVPRDRASDFVQETIVKALDYLRSCREPAWRPFPKVSVAWLMQIGYNLMIDWLRANRRAHKAKEEIVARNKARRMSRAEVDQLEEIHKFYTWLPPAEQEIVELILLKGRTPTEAGADLGISEAASYKRYERAITHLRELIREHGSMPDRFANE
jgi:RNA polymerase sigma factor (sigma-70 family)